MYDKAVENTRKRETIEEIKRHVKDTLSELKEKVDNLWEQISQT